MNRCDPQSMYALLDELNIPYRKVEHPEAGSMEELAEAEKQLGAVICKNLFLCNRQKTVFYLLLIRADKRFKTSVVSKLIGSSRLSFGEADKLYELLGVEFSDNEQVVYELLGVEPGSITPLGLVFDGEHAVNLLIDRDVLSLEEIGMHPLKNNASIAMKTDDLLHKYFVRTGHEPRILDIPEEAEA